MAAKYFDIHSTSSAQLLRLRKRGMIYSGAREKLINVSERRERLENVKECGQQRCWCTVSKRDGERKKQKLPVCLATMPACLSPVISFSQRSVPEDASIVLFVSRLFQMWLMCCLLCFLYCSCAGEKKCHPILHVAGKHAAQMMQMVFLNRAVSTLTLHRGDLYSDFFILVRTLLLQNAVMGCKLGHLMHSVY